MSDERVRLKDARSMNVVGVGELLGISDAMRSGRTTHHFVSAERRRFVDGVLETSKKRS